MVSLRGVGAGIASMALDQVAMSHRFMVRIDKGEYDLGSWTKVSGLRVSWAKHNYRPGESNDEVVVPGNITYDTVKLSRAACADSATVKKWLEATSRDRELLSGGVSMLDFTGIPVLTWNLRDFFPVAWSISDFDSTGARPAIEQLELAHNGFLDDQGGQL